MDVNNILNDAGMSEFQLKIDDAKAFVRYELRDDTYHLMHAEVPAALQGRGLGKVLAEKTFQAIRDEGRRGVAHCSYLHKVLRNDSRWADVIS